MNRLLIVLVIMLTSFSSLKVSKADFFHQCTVSGNKLWGPHGVPRTINIYLSINSTQALHTAFGLTQAQTDAVIRRALYILNEEFGTIIKLNFAGHTTNTGYINGAVVLKGGGCSPHVANTSQHLKFVLPTGWVADGAISTFFRQQGGDCHVQQWSITEAPVPNIDIVTTTVHEIMHGVFNVGHPNDPTYVDCDDFSQMTIMDSAEQKPPRPWVTKDWDREIVQQRYGHRAVNSSLYKSYRSPDTAASTTWQTANPATNQSTAKMLIHPGSLAQNVAEIHHAWPRNPLSSSAPGGAGTFTTAEYSGGPGLAGQQTLIDEFQFGAMFRPVAIARAPASVSNEMIVAYVVRIDDGTVIYTEGSDIGRVCFRHSTNGGATFGPQRCGSNGLPPPNDSFNFRVSRNGLTATYDPLSGRFLIAFLGIPSSSFSNAIHVWSFSRSGSLATQALTSFSGSSYIGSFHAPSIACSGTANGCRVVFEAADASNCTSMFKADVNSAGVLVKNGSMVNTCGITALYDTPSTSYNPSTQQYLMAIMAESDIVQTFKMSAAGLTFAFAGTLWNSSSSFISAPVLGQRTAQFGPKTQIWFLRYW